MNPDFVVLLKILGVVVVAALVISLPIILIRRWARGNKQKQPEVMAQEITEALAEFERAGMHVSPPSWTRWLAIFERYPRHEVPPSLSGWRVISGQHAGVKFEYRCVPAFAFAADAPAATRAKPGDEEQPVFREVSIPVSVPGEFQVCPETGGTEMVKQMGMVKEFQTRDASFDRRVYFSGSTDEYVKAVFGDAQTMQRLRTLFETWFDQLEKTEKTLTASARSVKLLGVQELKGAVEQLAAFEFPPAVPGQEGRRFTQNRMLYVLRVVALVLAVAGVAGFFAARTPTGGWIVFAIAMLPSVAVLCAAMLAAAYRALKGHSIAARGFIELMIVLPMLAICFIGIMAYANERFDGSEAEPHDVQLVKRYQIEYSAHYPVPQYTARRSGPRVPTYLLVFESWRGQHGEEFDVPSETYVAAREGQFWRLHVRQGFLGYAWVESMQPVR